MNGAGNREEVRALRRTRQQVAGLLHRYPRVSDAEAKRILAFLRTGPHTDIGTLAADEKLKPKFERFIDDHRSDLRLGFGEAATVLAAFAAALFVCLLIWELVRPYFA
jgi:hypothetical protein